MFAEKKALRRFLFIYLSSTIFLISIGEFFYYKLNYTLIIKEQQNLLQTKLTKFLQQNNPLIRNIRTNNLIIPKDIKLKIYLDNKEIFSNSPLLSVVITHQEIKRWFNIKIILTSDINQYKLDILIKKLIIFNIFIVVFLIITGVVLGKLFLVPMKDVIKKLEIFIQDATHEINTPISVILTNIELLEETKALNRIKNASIRLNKIFQDLKFISFENKQNKTICNISKNICLKKAILNTIELFQYQIKNKNLSLNLNLKEKTIYISQKDLNSLLENLISNAIKYAPKYTAIDIKLDDNLTICNIGFIKNIHTIKNRFTRENKNEGGFGLGLYIVDSICCKYDIKFDIKNIEDKVIVYLKL